MKNQRQYFLMMHIVKSLRNSSWVRLYLLWSILVQKKSTMEVAIGFCFILGSLLNIKCQIGCISLFFEKIEQLKCLGVTCPLMIVVLWSLLYITRPSYYQRMIVKSLGSSFLFYQISRSTLYMVTMCYY
jgi:hypothetical protein